QLCVSVFRQISQEITTIVEKRFDKFKIDHNPQIETAVEFRIEGKMYEDDKVLRCYNELYADGGLNFSYDDETSYLEFYKRHNDAYNLNLDQGHDELKKICICAVSASDALLMAYYNGHLSHSTLEDVVDDQIRNTYRLMKIPENRIEEIVKNSKKIEKIIDIQYLPYFEFE
ncbi:MAG: hypothetical protein RR614_05225, partial [Eubacterium sp.]